MEIQVNELDISLFSSFIYMKSWRGSRILRGGPGPADEFAFCPVISHLSFPIHGPFISGANFTFLVMSRNNPQRLVT